MPYTRVMDEQPMAQLIADHMEGGFLENIVDMFRHDPGLYKHVPGLMADERSRVRIGAVALVETLAEAHREAIDEMFPDILPLLSDPNPLVRADVAYLMGIVWPSRALPHLERAAREETMEPVRQVLVETVREIKESARSGGGG